MLLLFCWYLSKNWQNSYVQRYIFVPTKIFEVPEIQAARETSEFILLPEKRCHFLLFCSNLLKKKSEKESFYDVLTQEQGLVPFRSKCMWKRIIVSFKIISV